MNIFRIILMIFTVFCTNAHAVLNVDDQAPSFTLKSLDGDQVSLKSLRSSGLVMLVFWTTECVYCYMHIKDFNELQEKYRDKGLTIAAINFAGEHEQEVRDYVSENKLKYLMLTDRLKNIDVAQHYEVIGTPTIVLVSRDGKILFYGYNIPDLKKWISDNNG